MPGARSDEALDACPGIFNGLESSCGADESSADGRAIEKNILGDTGRPDLRYASAYMTVACRSFGEAAPWFVARQESGRQMLVAMETVPDQSLSGVMNHAQKLADSAAPGMFL